jgi:hypothetical protein
MPVLFGKDVKKIELISNLDKIYSQLESTYLISSGDFPELRKMKASMSISQETYLLL